MIPLLDATKHDPLAHWVRRRTINHNQNFMATFVGQTGEGKTTTKDTPVLMSDGSWKMCQDVEVGDEVFSLDKKGNSCFETVLKTYTYFSNDIYEVSQRRRDKKSLYFCSGDHKIPMRMQSKPRVGNKRPRELRKWYVRNYKAKELAKLTDYTMHGKYNFSVPKIIKFREEENVEIEPYTLGVILGDGHFNRALNITSIDKEIINEVILHYKLMSIYDKKGTNARSYAFSTKSILANQLIKLGLRGKNSGNKFIPFKCKTASFEYRKKLLAGLIDTDGTISKTGAISITIKSKQLAKDIKFVVHSLGGFGRVKKVKKKCSNNGKIGEYYKVSLYFKEKLLDLKHPMKKERYNKIKFNSKEHVNHRHIGIKVKKTARAEMLYGFMVSGDSHYFVTNDFMVTHNSWSAISFGESIDKRLNIDHVAASAKEMIEFIVDRKHPKGTCVVLDEAGVNFSSRNWMKKENKALGELFQTFRWMNIAILFTLPNFTFLDTQQRRLCHFTFESPSINREKNICYFKGKYLKHDDFSDKNTKYFPIIRYPDGKIAKAARFGFRLASKNLLDDYEKKKYEWNQGMLDKTKKIIVKGLDPGAKKVKNEKDWILKYELDGKALRVANEVSANLDDYLTYRGKRKGWDFNSTNIRADFVVKGIEATQIIRYLGKKSEIKDYLLLKNEEGAKSNG